jgi:hypothetical protein
LRSRRYFKISFACTAPGWLFKNSFGFRPEAAQRIAAMRLKFFHDPAERMIGVLPLGAHVRRTVGFSETPHSS